MSEPLPIGTLLEKAWSYAGLGLEVFPVSPWRTDGKRPLVSQKQATVDLDRIEAWWTRWPDALIGHRISPHHLLLDIDPRHNGKATWRALRAEMPEFRTRTHLSGRNDGGGHVWFQRPADKLTITKLDAWARERGHGMEQNGRWTCGIDLLRHEHRYTILPPSAHPETGEPYRWAEGRGLALDPAPMPSLLAELLVADSLPSTPAHTGPVFRDPDSIADWFSANHSLRSVLTEAGWVLVAGDGDEDGSRWRHPEASTAVSATVRHGCLFVYSTSTGFEPTTPEEPHGYTPFRAWAVLHHDGDLSRAGRAARRIKKKGVKPELTSSARKRGSDASDSGRDGGEDGGRELLAVPASSIVLRRVRWCWDGRLAVGTLGLLAGAEGLGKSTVACTIGAELTRGTLPGEWEGRPATVFVCATEDSWAHTIAPRFLAAGADLNRVFRIEAREPSGITSPLSLPEDLGNLEDLARRHEAALLILDPLISRLNAGLDSHRDGEVRRALEPLVGIAERTDMAVIGLIHHNKSGKTDPLDLVMASKAFTAVARSVHTVIRNPDDEGGRSRFFGTPKNNLGTVDLPTLEFTIEPFLYTTPDGEGSTGHVVWGATHGERIDELLRRAQQKAEGRTTKEDEAVEWLEELMERRGGTVAAVEALEMAKAAGYSKTMIDRARRRARVVSRKNDFAGAWVWVRQEPEDPEDPKSRPGLGSSQSTVCRHEDPEDPKPLGSSLRSKIPNAPKTGMLGSSGSSPRAGNEDGSSHEDPNKMSPPAHARAREGETHIDPESDEFDPELFSPDGSPWCRPDGRGGCLNGSRCRNPRHRGPTDD